MLMLVNLEDGIPPNLVSTVPVNSLDGRGEFEVVRVIFDLEKLKPEEVEAEIKKLLGPQGSVVSLGKSRQIAVTETAGRLRAIRTMLARMEGTDGTMPGGLRAIRVEVRPHRRRAAHRAPTARYPGRQERLGRRLDPHRPGSGRRAAVRQRPAGKSRPRRRHHQGARRARAGAEGAGRLAGTPQIEVYPVPNADAQAALSVLQTLLAGQPDVRLMVDPKTNNLVALARPAQQATIRATLAPIAARGAAGGSDPPDASRSGDRAGVDQQAIPVPATPARGRRPWSMRMPRAGN